MIGLLGTYAPDLAVWFEFGVTVAVAFTFVALLTRILLFVGRATRGNR